MQRVKSSNPVQLLRQMLTIGELRSFIVILLLLGSGIASAEVQKPDIVVAADGSGDFKTVQAAIDAVATNDSTRTVIFVKSGTYKEKLNVYPGEEVTSASLGRPWGNGARVVYLNCFVGPQINKEGWSIWRGRSNHETAYYAEYKNSGPGFAPADRLSWAHQLTEEEAATYTKEDIFKADSTTTTELKSDWLPVIADTSGHIQNTQARNGK